MSAIGHCKEMQQYKGPRYCDCKGMQQHEGPRYYGCKDMEQHEDKGTLHRAIVSK